MRWGDRTAAVIGAGVLLAALSGAAEAQVPPYPPPPPAAVPAPPATPQAAEIAGCLCQHRRLDALSTAMQSRRQAYDASKAEIGRLDAEMQRERATMNVDNPEAVARFRQLLARRDAAYRRSSGPLVSELSKAVSRYNQAGAEYNARCANRPWDPILLGQIQATLSCPAP
ncbi:MAG TPA: hypothetical protein VFX06_00520 [Stellaceae bacterium]|nr:hypothetical protein [Stellaceae bacterium]